MNKKLFIYALMSLPFIYSAGSKSYGQGSGSHGGNHIAREFVWRGHQINTALIGIEEASLHQVNPLFKPTYLMDALERIQVVSVENPIQIPELGSASQFDGSNQHHRIEIYSLAWRAATSAQRDALVLHELLGVVESLHPGAGEWDQDLQSSQYMALINRKLSLRREWADLWGRTVHESFAKMSALQLKTPTENRYCFSLFRTDAGWVYELDSQPKVFTTAKSPSTEAKMDGNGTWFIQMNRARSQVGEFFEVCPRGISTYIEESIEIENQVLTAFDFWSSNPIKKFIHETEMRYQKFNRQTRVRERDLLHLLVPIPAESEMISQFKESVKNWNRWVMSHYPDQNDQAEASAYAMSILEIDLKFQNRMMRPSLFSPAVQLDSDAIKEIGSDYITWVGQIPDIIRGSRLAAPRQIQEVKLDAILRFR